MSDKPQTPNLLEEETSTHHTVQDGRLISFIRDMGRATTDGVGGVVRFFNLCSHTMSSILRGRIMWRRVASEMYEVGNRSLIFIVVTLSFLSMVMIYQTATQMSRIYPDFSMLGAGYIEMMVKLFGPTLTALMIATRVGTGIAAEIGSMVVTEQVDALKMSNTDPVEYLVVPRFIACIIMVPMLAIVGTMVGIFAGMITADVGFDVNPIGFWDLQLVGENDIIVGLCKAFSCGVAIPMISAQAGLEAKGGSEGVGWATTRAIVSCTLAIVVIDLVWGIIGVKLL